MKKTIYWRIPVTHPYYRKIQQRFGLSGMTINGEGTADVSDDDIALFEECAHRGYFSIRNKANKNNYI